MTPYPDSNPDKVSGLADWPEPRTGIPTIIPTKCRDSGGTGAGHLSGHFVRIESRPCPPKAGCVSATRRRSRQFSRQTVATVGLRPIPTVSRQKCRDSGAARRGKTESRQTSRHLGGVSKAEAEQEGNPAKYPAILAGYAAPLPGHFVRLGALRKSRHQSRHGAALRRFYAKEGATVAEPATAQTRKLMP